MIKEDETIVYLEYCDACVYYGGRADTMPQIYCKNKECSAYRGRIEEFEEEGSFELVPPAYWGIQCEFMEKR